MLTPISLGITVSSRFPICRSIMISPKSALDEGAVVEPAVEPILIAGNVLLHGDVDVGLEDRDAGNVGVGEVDESLYVLLVVLGVADRSGVARAFDQRVHRLGLVAHGVEHRILAVI